MTDPRREFLDFVPGAAKVEEGVVAGAGKPTAPDAPAPTEEEIIEALRTCYDPEIPVNIYDLGLIYEISVGERGRVDLLMTLTTPNCPVAGILPQQVAEAVAGAENVGEAVVSLTWTPQWTKERMTDEARLALDMF